MATPIQFSHSLKGDYSYINTIAKNVAGLILTHYPHSLKTGNAIKIGNSDTIYYVCTYSNSNYLSLHESPENASTGQPKIKNIGQVGDNLYTLVKTYESINISQVENSLISITNNSQSSGQNFASFKTGDKVKFGVNTLGGGTAFSKLENASVKIINGGDNFSVAPTLTISNPDSGGTTATAKAIIDSAGVITKVIMTNPGAKYKSTPTVTLSNQLFTVKAISVTNSGSGYITTPIVEIIGGGGTGATAVPVLDGMSGSWTIQSITLTSPGQNYSSTPTVKISGGGVDKVGSLTLTSVGNNYQSAPTVTLVGGGGQGATAEASITVVEQTGTDWQGNPTYGTVTKDYVTSLTVTNAGSGYSQPPTVVFSGGDGSGSSGTTTTTYYPGYGGGGGSSGGETGPVEHATATASLQGINSNGTAATAIAIIGSSTANLQGSTEGTLGTLENELVDDIETDRAYFVRQISNNILSIHRTKQDAINNVNPLDFVTDNIFAGLSKSKVINDSEFIQTTAPLFVSQTTLSHNVLKNTVTLPVDNANGFASGKSIIIDENDCEQETNTILRATPTYLVLTNPLAHSHEKGKSVRLTLPNE